MATKGEIEDIETGHRLVATSMIMSAAIVAISQHWFLAVRDWISRVTTGKDISGH